MIELRWVARKFDHGVTTSCAYVYTKDVLRYRQTRLTKTKDGVVEEWGDWQDVPHEDEK